MCSDFGVPLNWSAAVPTLSKGKYFFAEKKMNNLIKQCEDFARKKYGGIFWTEKGFRALAFASSISGTSSWEKSEYFLNHDCIAEANIEALFQKGALRVPIWIDTLYDFERKTDKELTRDFLKPDSLMSKYDMNLKRTLYLNSLDGKLLPERPKKLDDLPSVFICDYGAEREIAVMRMDIKDELSEFYLRQFENPVLDQKIYDEIFDERGKLYLQHNRWDIMAKVFDNALDNDLYDEAKLEELDSIRKYEDFRVEMISSDEVWNKIFPKLFVDDQFGRWRRWQLSDKDWDGAKNEMRKSILDYSRSHLPAEKSSDDLPMGM